MRTLLPVLALLLMLTACARPQGCAHALTAEEQRCARMLPVDRLVLPGLVYQSGFVTSSGIVTARHGIPETLESLLRQTSGEIRSSCELVTVESRIVSTQPEARRLDPTAPRHTISEAAGDWCVLRTNATAERVAETDFDSPLTAGTEVVVHGFPIDLAHSEVSFVAVVTREKEIPGIGRLYEAKSGRLPELNGVSGGMVVRRSSLTPDGRAPAIGVFTLSRSTFSGDTLVWFVRPPPGLTPDVP